MFPCRHLTFFGDEKYARYGVYAEIILGNQKKTHSVCIVYIVIVYLPTNAAQWLLPSSSNRLLLNQLLKSLAFQSLLLEPFAF